MHGDIEFWKSLIVAFGYVGLFAIVFSECGLMIGFFLPGDSLLFSAGFLAYAGNFNIFQLVLVCFVAAVLGDSVGYWIGRKLGPKIFTKEDSLLFHKDHVKRTKDFYDKYGKKTIILARFVPIIRTFAPVLAGVGGMNYKTFLSFNIIGGALWAVGVPFLGYFLGSRIPDVDRYLLPIVLVIIFLSFLPVALHFLHEYRHRKNMGTKTEVIS